MIDAIFSFSTLWWIMMVLYVPACLGLIVIVLLQKGKGVGFAGAFGVGAGSETVFGPRASRSLPVRLTQVMAGLFMLLALGMTLVAGRAGRGPAPDLVRPDELRPTLMTIDELTGTVDEPAVDDAGAVPGTLPLLSPSAVEEATPADEGSPAPEDDTASPAEPQ